MAANRGVAVTNQVQLQTALDNAQSQAISYIDIAVDKITLTSPLIIRQTIGSPGNQVIINGAGCTIEAAIGSSLSYLMQVEPPTNQAQAASMLSNRFILRDITFNGRNNNTIGLELSATQGSEVHDCRFIGCSIGLNLLYAPMTRVTNCYFNGSSGISVNISFLFNNQVNAPTLGSAHTRVEQCTIINKSGSLAGVYISSSGNVVLDQLNFEGVNPDYHVYFSSNFQAAANNIVMRNLSMKTSAIQSAIKLLLTDGYAQISNVSHYTDQVLIDAEAQANYPKVYVEYLSNITSGTQFKTGGACGASDVIWSFYETQDGANIFIPTYWVGGNVPQYRYSEYFDNSKGIVTNYMKVNNNVIS
jgi:hypothetical protein